MAAEVRNRGGSVVLVSHVLTEVEQLCDRVGVLVGGRLVYVGGLAEFVQHPRKDKVFSLEQALQQFYIREGK